MMRGFQRASPAASSLARFLPTSTRLVWPSPRGVTNGVQGLLWFAASPGAILAVGELPGEGDAASIPLSNLSSHLLHSESA